MTEIVKSSKPVYQAICSKCDVDIRGWWHSPKVATERSAESWLKQHNDKHLKVQIESK